LVNLAQEPFSANAAQREGARGRFDFDNPIAVVDIGSNSVRLVAYEGLTRAPTPIFNDKVLAGLARGVSTTGVLPPDGVKQAIASLRRFRALIDLMRIKHVRVLATAASRDASNGKAFLAEAQAIVGAPIELISGKREAELSAKGVISGFHEPHGFVGDLGGGSLELVGVNGHMIGEGVSVKLGGLALQDAAGGSLKKAIRIVRETLEDIDLPFRGRTFFAVGGTWRALAKLHMHHVNYPLNVTHGYTIPARVAIEFCRMVQRVTPAEFPAIETVSQSRRPLIAYGALALEYVLRQSGAERVTFSAMGVREGLLYELLEPEAQRLDPLLASASELNQLRSRSPRHGEELAVWADRVVATANLAENSEDRRLRHAACLLADIGWRAHPDYRGEQSLNIIAHANFAGVSHEGRSFIALAVAIRHVGLSDTEFSPRLLELFSPRDLERARILGAIMRVAYPITAAMPGVLPRAPLVIDGGRLVLTIPGDLADLASERMSGRMKQLAKLLGKDPQIVIAT
jgi:exopolyphosphatase / guanosine-5'-triphosphate,3'-diphosphate pyrophosphatase